MVCSLIPGTAWSKRSAQMLPPPGSTPDFPFRAPRTQNSLLMCNTYPTPLYIFPVAASTTGALEGGICVMFSSLPLIPAQLGGVCPQTLRATVPTARGLPLWPGCGGTNLWRTPMSHGDSLPSLPTWPHTGPYHIPAAEF